MRIVRYSRGGTVSYGSQEGDVIHPITGDIFGQYQVGSESIPAGDVKLLAPVPNPSKILAIALNYQSHLGERPQPKVPEPFYKPTSSVVGPGDTVVLPKGAGRVDAEGELVVIIGRRCSKVSPQEAMDYVFGYTCGNDVSARIWLSSSPNALTACKRCCNSATRSIAHVRTALIFAKAVQSADRNGPAVT